GFEDRLVWPHVADAEERTQRVQIVTLAGAGHVKYQQVLFPRRLPGASSEHLDVEHLRLGGPPDDDAAHVGAVEALGQDRAVSDDRALVRSNPVEHAVPLLGRARIADRLAGDASAAELLRDNLGDLDGWREPQRLPPHRVPLVAADDLGWRVSIKDHLTGLP